MSKNMEMLYLLFPIIGAFILLFIACCFGKKMKEILHIPKEVVLGRTLPQSHRRTVDSSESDSSDDDGPRVTISIRNMTPRFPPPLESRTFEEMELTEDTEDAETGLLNNNEVTFNRNVPRCKSSPCISKDGYAFAGGPDGCSYIPTQCIQSPARSVSHYLLCPLPLCAHQLHDSPSHYMNMTGSVPTQLPSCYESLKQEDCQLQNRCSENSGGSSSTECACNPQRQCLGFVDVHVNVDYIDQDKKGGVTDLEDTVLHCREDEVSDRGNADLPSMPSSDSGCDMRGQSFDTMNDVTDDKLSPQHESAQFPELLEDEPG